MRNIQPEATVLIALFVFLGFIVFGAIASDIIKLMIKCY